MSEYAGNVGVLDVNCLGQNEEHGEAWDANEDTHNQAGPFVPPGLRLELTSDDAWSEDLLGHQAVESSPDGRTGNEVVQTLGLICFREVSVFATLLFDHFTPGLGVLELLDHLIVCNLQGK